MSRTPMPFYAGDVSDLARSLRRQLESLDHPPSHVEMLNLLAKAGGCRNFQHFKAQQDSVANVVPRPEPEALNLKLVKRLERFHDERGRLIRWPKKFSERMLCLWVTWSRLSPKAVWTEKEISQLLDTLHLFGDSALLRRELADYGFVDWTPDGSEYRRVERQPPAEALELFRRIGRNGSQSVH